MLESSRGKRYKICYVVTVPLTIRAFFMSQLKWLANSGMDVTVICSNDPELQRELGNDIKYYPIEIPRGLSVLKTLAAIRSLVCLFRKERFDIVQYSTPNAALCASVAAALAGCRIRNYHLMGFRYLGAHGVGRCLLKALEKLICSLSTSIECVSHSNLELGTKERVFNAAKATVVWNGSTGGVDLSRFNHAIREKWRQEIREELGIGPEDFVFGFVGRITRDKGINEIMAAFKECKQGKLLLIGWGEGVSTLDQELLSEARADAQIIFVDFVPDVERYYAAMDVLLLPSYREGFGNCVIEAAAVGTPAIVSNIPGPIDAVSVGETALCVEPGDSNDLRDKMLQMLHLDNKKMGNAANQFVTERFDSEILNQHILERKHSLIRRNNRS